MLYVLLYVKKHTHTHTHTHKRSKLIIKEKGWPMSVEIAVYFFPFKESRSILSPGNSKQQFKIIMGL